MSLSRDPAATIRAFFEVYNTLGFGFLESLYILALEYELALRGHRVDREVGLLLYFGREPCFYRLISPA